MDYFEYAFYKKLRKTYTFKGMSRIVQRMVSKTKINIRTIDKPVNILLLNAPCMGFGDIVFALKLYKYIREWYGKKVNVKIASPLVDKFITLGADPSSLIELKPKKEGEKNCLYFKQMEYSAELSTFDLFFVAPITADFPPDFKDVKKLIPKSNRLNTYFFSEYNLSLDDDIDFPVGVGSDRMGIFMIDPPKSLPPIPSLKNPYSLIYITDNDVHAEECYLEFIGMITNKCKHPKFDIVASDWIYESIKKNLRTFINTVDTYYDRIVLVTKVKEEVILDDGDNDLYIRFDVLPLPFTDMLRLYKHTEDSALLTGDQSITDFLSVNRNKKIPYYQRVDWKRNFADNLSKQLPQKFLKSYTTSCGTIEGINYHPDLDKFLKNWDFRTRAKKTMDSVVIAAHLYKTSPLLVKFMDIYGKSKTAHSVKSKINKEIIKSYTSKKSL